MRNFRLHREFIALVVTLMIFFGLWPNVENGNSTRSNTDSEETQYLLPHAELLPDASLWEHGEKLLNRHLINGPAVSKACPVEIKILRSPRKFSTVYTLFDHRNWWWLFPEHNQSRYV
ncbi:hypothetical protein SY88_07410 [Clostridiales bacterium PH28_bin88]|nr:hypothetical protein SY88_07410 [Clostridiales bacterium PH28_bin88]